MHFLTIFIIFIVSVLVGGFVDKFVDEEYSGIVNVTLLIIGIIVGCMIWL